VRGWLAHLCGFCKGGDSCSLRPDFPPVTTDLIVPTFTRNVKVGQPRRLNVMADEIAAPRSASVWWSRTISALLGIAVTVIGSLIIQKVQSREPHLTYSSVETVPFNGQNGVVGIYQVIVRNDGKREVEDVTSHIQIPGAKIEQYRIIVAPSLTTTTSENGDVIRVNLPSLNPGETAQISILASNPTSLPNHPEISVRAKGVNGVEQASPPSRLNPANESGFSVFGDEVGNFLNQGYNWGGGSFLTPP
jgi:hypothetical protein